MIITLNQLFNTYYLVVLRKIVTLMLFLITQLDKKQYKEERNQLDCSMNCCVLPNICTFQSTRKTQHANIQHKSKLFKPFGLFIMFRELHWKLINCILNSVLLLSICSLAKLLISLNLSYLFCIINSPVRIFNRS